MTLLGSMAVTMSMTMNKTSDNHLTKFPDCDIRAVWHCCNVFFLGGGVGGGSWGGSWHGAEDRPKGPNKADQTGTSGRKIIDIQIQICRIKHIWFSLLFFIVHQ